MKTIVAFSGGKDSMAALLWVRNNLTKNFITVFCDTGFESKITYDYIEDIASRLNLDLRIIKSKKFDGFVDMAKKKGRFPSSKARFCTGALKSHPMIDFILDEVKEDALIIQGIRADESHARSLMEKQCTYFKYYKQSYGKDKNGNPKFHTYRRKEVLDFANHFSDDILRPIFNWTAQETIDYIKENGLEPNPLYEKGMKRVGCFPCIMSNQRDLRSLIQFFPERIKELMKFEKEVGSSFFPPDKIPKWACSNQSYPMIDDIEAYLKHKHSDELPFEEYNNVSCMSFYGLCE